MHNWNAGGYFTDDLLIKRDAYDDDFEQLQDYRTRILPPGTPETLFLSHITARPPMAPPGLIGRVSPSNTNNSTHSNAGANHLPTPSGRSEGYPSTSPASGPSPLLANTGSYAPSTTTTAPSSAFGPVGVSAALAAPMNDLERQRREREDFLRSLREKELASHAPNVGVLGGSTGFGMGGLDGMGSLGGGLGSSASSNVFQPLGRDDTFSSGLPLANGVPNYSMLAPISTIPQPQQPSYQALSPTSYSQAAAGFDSIYSPTSLNQPQSSIWSSTPNTTLPERAGTFGQSAVQANQTTSPWYSIIEPSPAAQFDSTPNAFHNVNPPQTNVWTQQAERNAAQQSMATAQLAPAFDPVHTQEPSPQALEAAASHYTGDSVSATSQAFQPNGDSVQPLSASLHSLALQEEGSVPPSQPLSGTATANAKSPQKQGPSKSSGTTQPAIAKPPAKSSAWGSTTLSSDIAPASIFTEAAAATPSPATSKPPVWANFNNSDDKGASAISLRKIQEAEAKKAAELRKAERERERAVKANAVAAAPTASSPASSVSLSEGIGSWGLPQVGRAAPHSTASPAAPSPTAAAVAGAWATKPAPVTKKTMKEIQEEEEKKRKKEASQQREVQPAPPAPAPVAAAAKRGYADSAKVRSQQLFILSSVSLNTLLVAHWIYSCPYLWCRLGDYWNWWKGCTRSCSATCATCCYRSSYRTGSSSCTPGCGPHFRIASSIFDVCPCGTCCKARAFEAR